MGEPKIAAEPRAPWQPGDVVGRYSMLARLATGGMAEIWLARQAGPRDFEKVVVIKKITDALSEDPDFVEMFLDEARIAAQLNHPNIVQIYDLGEHRSAFYIAMEYLAGENLASVVRAGVKAGRPLPVPYAARLVASAAEGLGYAHAKVGLDGRALHIVHRDVSPQNLILTYDGVLKVVDFGIAKAANRASRTTGGQLKGKVSYMSPEQARGEGVDERSDIFALGVVLYEAITRSRLFQFDDPMQALSAITSPTPVESACGRNPEVPPALDAIVLRALEKDREKRWPTARNFQVALEDFLRKQEDAPGSTELSAYMRMLFRERIDERRALIESARRGELSPGQMPAALRSDTEKSMPGASSAGLARRRSRLTYALVGVVAVVAGTLAGRATVTRTMSSPPRELPAPVATLSPASAAVPAAIPVPVPAAMVSPPPPKPAPPRPVAHVAHAAQKKGKLTLDTIPWTQVYLGEKKLGDTPLVEVILPAGKQVLTLVNEAKGIRTPVEVEVAPDKTTVKKLRL